MKQKPSLMRGRAAIAAVVNLLAACQSVQPYVPPTEGDTAKLLIRPTVGAGMAYGVYLFDDARTCRNPRRITVGNAGTGNQSSALRASALTTLQYLGSDRTRSCVVSFSFQPKARHTYLLATSQDGVGCGVRLLDATDGENPRPEKTFVERTMKPGGCEPLNKTQRTGDAISQGYQGTQKTNGADSAKSLDDFKDLLPK